jgi:hypothetical protein
LLQGNTAHPIKIHGMTSSPDFTILLQGQFTAETAKIVRQLRQADRLTPIVVSCWESDRAAVPQDVANLVSELVFSEDPGSPRIEGFKVDNIRRQLVSTSAGLARVKSAFVLKLRSDLMVDVKRVRNALALCTPVEPDAPAMFGHKVVVTSLTTLDARRSGYYFHVCDWLYLGRTNDLRVLFAAELPSGVFFEYFRHSLPRPEICSQYRSEAYMVYQLARRLGLCGEYRFSGECSDQLADRSQELIRANFTVVNPWNLGLSSSKHRKLYLWMHPNRHTERTCGARVLSLGRRAALAELLRESASRAASRLALEIIRLRDGRPHA